MKHWLFIILCTPFLIFANPTPILPEDAMVKVLVSKDLTGVLIEVKGNGKIFNMSKKKSIHNTEAQRLWLTLDGDTFRWGDVDLDCDQIAFVPSNRETSFLIDGIQYKGAIYVFNLDGKMAIVNGLGIEEYLETVLTTKLKEPLVPAALDALTIVVRTNVVRKIQKLRKNLWHFDASKEGFKGFGILNENQEILASCQNTRSLILQPENQIEQLGFDIKINFSDIALVSNDKPVFTVNLAKDRAKYHQNAAKILKVMFPSCSIEKFDHKLMMEVESSLEE